MTKSERREQSIKPMPPLETVEEEAEVWNRRSAVDETDDGALVGLHRSRKSGSLTIRFQPEDILRLREQADQWGIGPTTLARMWILEHLRRGHGKPA